MKFTNLAAEDFGLDFFEGFLLSACTGLGTQTGSNLIDLGVPGGLSLVIFLNIFHIFLKSFFLAFSNSTLKNLFVFSIE